MKEELTITEAAALLRVSEGTIKNLVKRGMLRKYYKPFGRGPGARRVFFIRSELDALLAREKAAAEVKQPGS